MVGSDSASLVSTTRSILRQVHRAAPRSRREAFTDRVVGWRRDRFGGASTPGALLAMLGTVLSNTPSLLPRPWFYQGLIAAIVAVVGYVVGVALGGIGHRLRAWSGLTVTIRPSARHTLVGLWLVVLALGVLAFPFTTLDWQRRTAAYVGAPLPGAGWVVLSVGTTVAAFAGLVGVWRLVAGLIDWVTHHLGRRILSDALARVVASVVVFGSLLVGLDTVVLRGVFLVASRTADSVNAQSPEGYTAPTSSLRSGGPGSPETWSSLGQDGAVFVAAGPSRSEIAAATGRPALEPIRVFAGNEGRSLEQTRDAVLAELDRTGAWSRRSIQVVTSTSTGFVNVWSVAAFEFLQDGDTATVSMQYSSLPSALATLADRETPPRAARVLLDGVRARLAAIPADRRPRLYLGGESLGAFGGNGAFDSAAQMLAQADGGVWTGTPDFTPVRGELSASRAFGSTLVVPVVDDGRQVRFAGRPEQVLADQFGHPYAAWTTPRFVYLQHDTDPVAWWSPDLLFSTPEWLLETRRPGTPMAQMSWLPVVTFWQLTADMAMANSVPGGFGHRYFQAEVVPAWGAVLGLDPGTDFAPIVAAIGGQLADLAAQQGG